MAETLGNLDKDQSKNIDAKELELALSAWFFDNQENIALLQQELLQIDGLLEKSFCNTLRVTYVEAKKWPPTIQNQKIVSLFEVLLGEYPERMQFSKEIGTLPTPQLQLKDWFENIAYEKLVKRYETSYPSEYQQAKVNAVEKHMYKPEAYRWSYVQYEIAKKAIDRYMALLEKEQEKVVTQQWYSSLKQFDSVADSATIVMNKLGKEVAQKYPNIETDQKEWLDYNSRIGVLAKQMWYDKPSIYEQHAKLYKAYDKKLTSSIDLQQYQDSILFLQSPQITDNESMVKYLNSSNYIQEASAIMGQLQKEAWSKMLTWFTQFNKWVADITKSFGEEKVRQLWATIQSYSSFVDGILGSSNIDVAKFMKTQWMLQENGWNGKYHDAVHLYNSINNPGNKEESFFRGVVRHAEEKKQKQSKIDVRYSCLESMNPSMYQTVNFLTGAWNGLVGGIVWTGSSLWVMREVMWKYGSGPAAILLGMLEITCEYNAGLSPTLSATLDFKEMFDNFLKFNLSSSMNEPPIDKNGKRNLKLDNTINQVGQQVANMLVLLYSWTGIVQWASRLWVNVGSKLALFSSSMIQQSGSSFIDAKSQWLSDIEAFWYSMLSSIWNSAMELISPNQLITGQRKNVLQNLVGQTGQKRIIATFAKHLGKELFEENIQESAQLAFQKGINMRANGSRDVKFNDTFSREEFGTTAVLTTLTTGLTAAPWISQQTQMDNWMDPSQMQQLILEIARDPILYEKYMGQIKWLLDGSRNATGLNIQGLEILKEDLQWLKNNSVESDLDTRINPDKAIDEQVWIKDLSAQTETVESQQLESVLNDPVIKPEWCTDQEFKDAMYEMAWDFTNYCLLAIQTRLTYKWINDKSYTNEKEFIELLQKELSVGNVISFEEYKNTIIPRHYPNNVYPPKTINLLNFTQKYPEYIQKTELLIDALKNWKYENIEQFLRVYNKLVPMVDSHFRPTEYTRYVIDKASVIPIFEKWLKGKDLQAESTYFEGKKSKFGFTKEEAIQNGKLRGNWWKEAVRQKLIELATLKWVADNLELSDQQIQLIEKAHNVSWVMWKLTKAELRQRVLYLQEAFQQNPNSSQLVRLSLESGISWTFEFVETGEMLIDQKVNIHNETLKVGESLTLSLWEPTIKVKTQQLLTSYPNILDEVINPAALQTIIQTEISTWNLVLNSDGTLKEVFVEINGEKRPSQLFATMKANWYSESLALKAWLQVRTPEFKNRFGNWQSIDKNNVSKVVDENGEPLVVYHRTDNNFSEFDPARIWQKDPWYYWKWFYFSTKQNIWFGGQLLLPSFLCVKNMKYDVVYFRDQNNNPDAFLTKLLTIDQQVDKNMILQDLKNIVEWKNDRLKNNTTDAVPQVVQNTREYIDRGNYIIYNFDQIYKEYRKYDGATQTSQNNIASNNNSELVIFDPKNIKSAIDNDWSFSPETAKFNDYFWKESRFWFDSKKARDNSEWMDLVAWRFVKQTDNSKITGWFEDVRKKITDQYTKITGKTIELTDGQIQTIITTHLNAGELGKHTQTELRTKVQELATAVPDADLRRFLLEGGFCGTSWYNTKKNMPEIRS